MATRKTPPSAKAKRPTPPRAKAAELPTIAFPDAAAFDAWLEANHATSPGLWLQIAKKDSGIASITYAEAVERALCWGWIDGQKASLDERAWLQRFTRRGRKSIWSVVNRESAKALIASGTMRAPGLAEVERAQADGRWDAAYAPQSKAEVPADLLEALAKSPRASAFFAGLDSRNRYAVLHRVHTAKKPETRARRIEQFVDMLARHEKLWP